MVLWKKTYFNRNLQDFDGNQLDFDGNLSDLIPWVRFHGSDSMGPIPWVRLHGSDSMGPIPWVRFHGFDSMGPIPLSKYSLEIGIQKECKNAKKKSK